MFSVCILQLCNKCTWIKIYLIGNPFGGKWPWPHLCLNYQHTWPPSLVLYTIREVDKHFIKIRLGWILHQTNIAYCRWRGCPYIWGKETWHHGTKSFYNLPSVMSTAIIMNRTKVMAVNNILDIANSGLNLKLFNLHLKLVKDSWFNSAWTGL